MSENVKEKFRSLSFREKLVYIFEYYSFHMAAAAATVIALCSVAYVVFINPLPDIYSGIVFYDAFLSDNKVELISQELNESLGVDKGHEVRVTTIYSLEDDPIFTENMQQKFEMLLVSKDVDAIIAPEESFKALVYNGYIVDLPSEAIDIAGNRQLLYANNVQDETILPYGISLEDSELLSVVPDMNTAEMYAGFIRHGERIDNTIKTISELIK